MQPFVSQNECTFNLNTWNINEFIFRCLFYLFLLKYILLLSQILQLFASAASAEICTGIRLESVPVQLEASEASIQAALLPLSLMLALNHQAEGTSAWLIIGSDSHASRANDDGCVTPSRLLMPFFHALSESPFDSHTISSWLLLLLLHFFVFILPSIRRLELFLVQVTGGGKCKQPQLTHAVTESIPPTGENTPLLSWCGK